MTTARSKAGTRRSVHRALREFYIELRTAEEGPMQTAAAVFVGTVIGCLPVYGLHLAACVLASRLLRLSATKLYLAAHINNPFTAPLIVASSLVLGRSVIPFSDQAPAASRFASSAVRLGSQLVIGAIVLGVGLGLVLAATAYFASRRWSAPPQVTDLRRGTARRFLSSGVSHWEFVRAKLRYDPLYFDLLDLDIVKQASSIVDLGCGRGILLALIAEVDESRSRRLGVNRTLVGLEHNKRAAIVAARALRGDAKICVADLSSVALPAAEVIVAADVLHYLSLDHQKSLLRRAVASLNPGGSLLVREADADGGWRFQMIRIGERLRAIGRGDWRPRFHYRPATELAGFLRGLGLDVEAIPMARGTLLANVLIVGSLPGKRQVENVES